MTPVIETIVGTQITITKKTFLVKMDPILIIFDKKCTSGRRAKLGHLHERMIKIILKPLWCPDFKFGSVFLAILSPSRYKGNVGLYVWMFTGILFLFQQIIRKRKRIAFLWIGFESFSMTMLHRRKIMELYRTVLFKRIRNGTSWGKPFCSMEHWMLWQLLSDISKTKSQISMIVGMQRFFYHNRWHEQKTNQIQEERRQKKFYIIELMWIQNEIRTIPFFRYLYYRGRRRHVRYSIVFQM